MTILEHSDAANPDAMTATAARALWVWVNESPPPLDAELSTFCARRRITDVFLSVPWGGPTVHTRRCATALRVRGIRVSALGGDPSWVEGDAAVKWMQRSDQTGLFDSIHLDIEPWVRDDWAGNEAVLAAGLAHTIRAVAARTPRPVEIDLPPWVGARYPAAFADCARSARTVTLMAYRDRAADILSVSADARRLLSAIKRPYRIGVDTRPAPCPADTFADDGCTVLERELAAVTGRLTPDENFAGTAVHDYTGWHALGP